MGPHSWPGCIRDLLTRRKLPTPPNPLRSEMRTRDAIVESKAARERLYEQIDRFNALVDEIRDEDWRLRHD